MDYSQQHPNWNPRLRHQGNFHHRSNRRDFFRVEASHTEVMPAQTDCLLLPKYLGLRYKLGAPQRPSSIKFDNGFLDRFKARAPTSEDRTALNLWRLKLTAANKLRPDLSESFQAYRHFLRGQGKPRAFSYEQYVLADKSGQTTLSNAILDIQDGVEIICHSNWSGKRFSLTGEQIICGNSTLFPYPETENWQRAIGGHIIWLSGHVEVNSNAESTWLTLELTLHAESQYNFKPDHNAMTTGSPSNDNGIFEITGLGKQYRQTSTLQRIVKWKLGNLDKFNSTTTLIPSRQRAS